MLLIPSGKINDILYSCNFEKLKKTIINFEQKIDRVEQDINSYIIQRLIVFYNHWSDLLTILINKKTDFCVPTSFCSNSLFLLYKYFDFSTIPELFSTIMVYNDVKKEYQYEQNICYKNKTILHDNIKNNYIKQMSNLYLEQYDTSYLFAQDYIGNKLKILVPSHFVPPPICWSITAKNMVFDKESSFSKDYYEKIDNTNFERFCFIKNRVELSHILAIAYVLSSKFKNKI